MHHDQFEVKAIEPALQLLDNAFFSQQIERLKSKTPVDVGSAISVLTEDLGRIETFASDASEPKDAMNPQQPSTAPAAWRERAQQLQDLLDRLDQIKQACRGKEREEQFADFFTRLQEAETAVANAWAKASCLSDYHSDAAVLSGSVHWLLDQAEQEFKAGKLYSASQWLQACEAQFGVLEQRPGLKFALGELKQIQVDEQNAKHEFDQRKQRLEGQIAELAELEKEYSEALAGFAQRKAALPLGTEDVFEMQARIADTKKQIEGAINGNGQTRLVEDGLRYLLNEKIFWNSPQTLGGHLASIKELSNKIKENNTEIFPNLEVVQQLEERLKECAEALKKSSNELKGTEKNKRKINKLQERQKLVTQINKAMDDLKQSVAERTAQPLPDHVWYTGNLPTQPQWQHIQKTSAEYYRKQLDTLCDKSLVDISVLVTRTQANFKAKLETTGTTPTIKDLIEQERALLKARLDLNKLAEKLDAKLKKFPPSAQNDGYATIRQAREQIAKEEKKLAALSRSLGNRLNTALETEKGTAVSEEMINKRNLYIKERNRCNEEEWKKIAEKHPDSPNAQRLSWLRVRGGFSIIKPFYHDSDEITKNLKTTYENLYNFSKEGLTRVADRIEEENSPITTLSEADTLARDFDRWEPEFHRNAKNLKQEETDDFTALAKRLQESHTKLCYRTIQLINEALVSRQKEVHTLSSQSSLTEENRAKLKIIRDDFLAYQKLLTRLIRQSREQEATSALNKCYASINQSIKKLDKALPKHSSEEQKATERGILHTIVDQNGEVQSNSVQIYVKEDEKLFLIDPKEDSSDDDIKAVANAAANEIFDQYGSEIQSEGIYIRCHDTSNPKQMALTKALYAAAKTKLEERGLLASVTIRVIDGSGNLIPMDSEDAVKKTRTELSQHPSVKYTFGGGGADTLFKKHGSALTGELESKFEAQPKPPSTLTLRGS